MAKIRVYASISTEDLKRFYELNYLFGKFISYEIDHGYLPENATLYKDRVSSQLYNLCLSILHFLKKVYEDYMENSIRDEAEYSTNHIYDLVESGFLEDDRIKELKNYGIDISNIVNLTEDEVLSKQIYEGYLDNLTFEDTFNEAKDRIINTYNSILSALESKNIADMCAAIHQALNLAHQTGEMIEYIAPTADLDELASMDISNLDKQFNKWTGNYRRSKRVYANEQDLQLVFGDELFEMDIVNNDPWALARLSDINIMAPNLLASYVDMNFSGVGDGVVVAAVFDEYHPSKYSFDVVVHPKYKGKGLGTKLIEIAMDKYKSDILEVDPETILELDVVNTRLVEFLRYKYHLEIKEQIGGHTIMGKMINV